MPESVQVCIDVPELNHCVNLVEQRVALNLGDQLAEMKVSLRDLIHDHAPGKQVVLSTN